ncbi:hypothetical protein FPSE5266_05222 [Fusarium pseudograminearum]|nr:hypothetical protein FPSE5266_05222 [Fusarium pseudograminearum]
MDSPDWDIDAVFWFQLYNDTDVKGEDPIAITQMFNVSTSDSSSNRESDTFVYINRGLSTGATAGIAVGSVAGALLLAGLGFFLWRRSQRAKDAAVHNTIHYLCIMKSRNVFLGHLFLQSVQAATLRALDSSTPTITWSQCNLDIGNEIWNRLQKAYDCAKFSVPLDYTNEDSSRPLVLDLIKVNATKHPRKGSVFYNPGGPGSSGVSSVIDSRGRLVDVLGGHYDVISFDPRGSGQTLTATCGGYFDSSLSTLSPQQILYEGDDTVNDVDWKRIKCDAWRNAGELADACYKDHADTGRFYGTPFVARDIVKIADALGEGNQINYWGSSYGTVLGQVLAAMFPNRIGRMLLDSNLLADEYFTGTWKSGTKDAEKAILHFFDECIAAGPQSCSLAANYSTKASLLKAYSEAQMLYRFDDTLSTTGRPNSKANQFESLLDARIKGALEGNEAVAFLPFSSYDDIDSNGASALYMIACGDASFRPNTPDDLFSIYQANLDQGPFGDTAALDRFQCARWKFQAAEQIDANSLRRIDTKNPVLIVNGIYDPITPLISAWEVSSRFPGSRVVVHEGVGHSFTTHPSNCTDDIVARYFNSGSMPKVDTTCKPNLSAFEYIKLLRGYRRDDDLD